MFVCFVTVDVIYTAFVRSITAKLSDASDPSDLNYAYPSCQARYFYSNQIPVPAVCGRSELVLKSVPIRLYK